MKRQILLSFIFSLSGALLATPALAEMCPKDDELKQTRGSYVFENGDAAFVNVVAEWVSTSVSLDDNARIAGRVACTYSLYDGSGAGRQEIVALVPRTSGAVLTNPEWDLTRNAASCTRERRLCTWVR
ncbi:hypothetical protein [Parvularcula sp. IMCC14364]|uniref:hypothetical protein n=1 Tax=Parvularcula sp. IMCC14364 TaxID=3067902 RepID=UPI0027413829|nr:hypothetical protein [Parvularcula sp. IMCC14364]